MDLETAVAAGRAEFGDRVRPYGWTDGAGTFIFDAPFGSSRDDVLGEATYVRVSPDGAVAACPFIVVMDDISRMQKVGDWPAPD